MVKDKYLYTSTRCGISYTEEFETYKEAINQAMLHVKSNDTQPLKITQGNCTIWGRQALIGRYYLSTNSLGCYSPQYIASFK